MTKKEIRRRLGIPQESLAKFLGVTRSTLNMAERRRRLLPTIASLRLGLIETTLQKIDKLLPNNENELAASDPRLQAEVQRLLKENDWQTLRATRQLKKKQWAHKQSQLVLQLINELSREPLLDAPDKPTEIMDLWQRIAERNDSKNDEASQLVLKIRLAGLAAEREVLLACQNDVSFGK